jgi:trehalose utilization protein
VITVMCRGDVDDGAAGRVGAFDLGGHQCRQVDRFGHKGRAALQTRQFQQVADDVAEAFGVVQGRVQDLARVGLRVGSASCSLVCRPVSGRRRSWEVSATACR